MKYLECECCGFLAAIPVRDDHNDLQCPFCHRAQCDHGGRFIAISRESFLGLSDDQGLLPDYPALSKAITSLREAHDTLRIMAATLKKSRDCDFLATFIREEAEKVEAAKRTFNRELLKGEGTYGR